MIRDDERPVLGITMPAFNEIGNLRDIVVEAIASLDTGIGAYEVLIVDDGSTDGTGALADELAAAYPSVRVLHHGTNRGFAAAWRSCIAASTADWLFICPADGQIAPAVGRDFYEHRGRADVVLGVRTTQQRSLVRRMISAVFDRLTRFALRIPFSDFTVGLYRGDLVRSLQLRSSARSATLFAEVLLRAHRRGAAIIERPIRVLPRRSGRAKGATAAVMLHTFIDLVRLALDRSERSS